MAEEFSETTDLGYKLQRFSLQWEAKSCLAEVKAGQVNAQNCRCCLLPKQQVSKDHQGGQDQTARKALIFHCFGSPHHSWQYKCTVTTLGSHNLWWEQDLLLYRILLPQLWNTLTSSCPQCPSLGNQTITGGNEWGIRGQQSYEKEGGTKLQLLWAYFLKKVVLKGYFFFVFVVTL